MKKMFLFLLILSSYFSNAQPSIAWQKCLGGTNIEHGSSIQQTTDGGYILVGMTGSYDGDVSGNNGGTYDIWVVKLSSIGALEWKKCLGGTGYDWGYFIQQTTEGGYILIGRADSNDGDVSGNHGGGDIWVVKLSNLGVIQWQKCLGGSGTASETGFSIKQTTDGGYILCGVVFSNDGDVSGNHGATDIWVAKLSNSGIIQWQKCLGGTLNELAYTIQQTTDGGYILCGHTQSNDGDVSGNHGGSRDIWVVKLSNLGAIEWQKCLGGTGTDTSYYSAVQQTTDGGYILAGYTQSNDGNVFGNHGGGDVWIVKLTSIGLIEWQKCLGGTSSESGASIQQTTDGGYILCGNSQSNDGDVSGNHGSVDGWLVKLSNLGAIQWQKCLGGTNGENIYSIQQTSDGGYILTGFTSSNDGDVSGNHGGSDVWIVKLTNENLSDYNFESINNISVAPNPASSQININFNNITNLNGGTLKIINSLGQEVATTPITTSGTNSSMQLATWGGTGMYFVQIINPQGQIVDIKKIILQ